MKGRRSNPEGRAVHEVRPAGPPGNGTCLSRCRGRACLLLLALLGAGCTFERRAGSEAPEEVADAGSVEVEAEPSPERTEAAALRTVDQFRGAVATGDLSSALALVDREAVFLDELVGEASEAATRGELLLELRRRHAEGTALEPVESRVLHRSDEAALVLTLLAMLEVDEDGIGREVGRLHETVLLIATPEGWRILHLHRSMAEPDAELPGEGI